MARHRCGCVDGFPRRLRGSQRHRTGWPGWGQLSSHMVSGRKPDRLSACRSGTGRGACDAPFHVWVVNADGTGAHRVTAIGTPMTWNPAWSPNGFRLSCSLLGVGAVAVDADGTDLAVLPNVRDMADWSPDGMRIVSASADEGESGASGHVEATAPHRCRWEQPEVLFERFLSYADADAHIALYGSQLIPGKELLAVTEGVGPSYPDWSPLGTASCSERLCHSIRRACSTRPRTSSGSTTLVRETSSGSLRTRRPASSGTPGTAPTPSPTIPR